MLTMLTLDNNSSFYQLIQQPIILKVARDDGGELLDKGPQTFLRARKSQLRT